MLLILMWNTENWLDVFVVRGIPADAGNVSLLRFSYIAYCGSSSFI
ncbi:Uncharacterised protein [Salmonella enterica]|nr:Uncharacterised protein [Salmonella enterica]